MRFIVPLITLLLVVSGLVALVQGLSPPEVQVTQPIAFNHTIHLEEAEMECLDCHTDARTSASAGLPGKNVCLDCHDVDDEEVLNHPEKAKLVPFADSDRNIPWVRVAVTRPDVFFSHRRHVAAGGIDCLTCHTDQRTLTTPPSTVRLVMTMDDCIACHEEDNVSTDCLACHR